MQTRYVLNVREKTFNWDYVELFLVVQQLFCAIKLIHVLITTLVKLS